ncbi:DHS-like NAD/FAD-binding domain-containing protein [Macrolepiota fuliginosa MF-IS2]|uniref:NAD-dependent protein deacylase n=1 Tax=Macrolepiota fuliginosa MF-IS2 TaxID=1400762 RepID=A0A9P5XGN6_9AGAR|nr:DHS-like NAD/FAD-binding domain-containing protein [Macrolepiota fuliginosa MF-IS2]
MPYPFPAPSSDVDAFRNVLKKSVNIIVVAGAGLSAGSGLSTFRGAGGYWRRFKATTLATPEAFEKNPSRVWQFYHYRREFALRAKPNAAHYALARFTSPQIRESICAPKSTFTVITQNVDGISPRALKEVTSSVSIPEGTHEHPHIIEMHGRLFDVICAKCDHVSWNINSPICDALAGTEKILEAEDHEVNIPVENLPRCEGCGELARPGVVWFGETPRDLDLIDDLAQNADLCLVVGTSSTVYPAAGYADIVRGCGGKVAVFNMERTSGDEDADFLFLGPCEETIPAALGIAQEI